MTSDQPTVYLAIKFHSDHRNRELIDQISAVFEAHGLATICVARDFEEWGEIKFEAHDLMQVALDAIRQSDALVLEFSEKGTGLGIEAGYASAFDIPIFVLHRPGADVSTTLRGVSSGVFGYPDDESLNSAVARIADQIGPALPIT
jgi:nucleoside 2-deoxyribosyltransferase